MLALDTVVRTATPADAVDLARLRWQWRVDEQGERGSSLEAFTVDFASWWAAHADSHLGFLALVESRPVGMAWLAIIDRVPGPAQLLRRAGSLQSVYVCSAERGRGIGARLVEAAVGAAAEDGLEYVSVHPSARSFSLYRRAGFTDTSGVLELDGRDGASTHGSTAT
ncbi:MAG: GNAT family N-acetyltransferase [Acidothermaceae bacterium]